MTCLWVKILKNHKIVSQATVECSFQQSEDTLTEICRDKDIPYPIWLNKHRNEFDSFRRTVFRKGDFMEEVSFDKLEIEFLEDDSRRKSSDPRNAFDF